MRPSLHRFFDFRAPPKLPASQSRRHRALGKLKSGSGNVKILLPGTMAQGIAGSGEQREAAAGRLCWRRPPRKAFYLRRGTPTWSGFSRPAGAYVGVALPVKPFTSVEARQHGPDYPGLPAPMLASTSSQSLLPPSRHANMVRIFSACRRLCWCRPPRKAFYLRRGTPTWSGLSRLAGAYVGVDLLAKPFTSVETRQHGPDFPGRRASMLASTSPQSLLPSSRHANMVRIFPACRPPGKAKIEKIRTCH